MSYLGGKQQPPLNRSRHPPRYGPQQIYHNQYERPPETGGGGVPLPQPGGRYNVPLSAQPRGYGPPPGAGDGQPLQYMPPPRPYQQPMHEMAKQNLELPSVPGYPGPHQHHQAPVLRPGAPLVTGAPGYSAHQMMAGPRPPAPAPGYPPGGHAISMPPPPAPHSAAAFSMAGGLPPGQAPPMMMFFSPGQVPPGGQGHPGVRQGPTAYMPTPPVYSTQPPYQQQLTVQPPQGLYVQAQPQPAPGGQPAPPQMWGPPPPPAQMSLPPPMEPLQARRPQEPLYAPPVPPPAPVQHHASHRIPIINPETHEEVAVSGSSAQTPSGVPETAWRPLGNGVSTLPRSGRQHSSASVSELGEPDSRRGPRARSSASYSECPLPGEGVPEWAPAPAMAPQAVPGRFQTPTANGLSTHSPDVIRRQVMNYASPASTVRQSEWNPARAPGWCPPVPPSRPSDGHYSLPASLPDLVPVPSVPPGLPPPDSALQYSQAAPRPDGTEMGLQYGQSVPPAVSARLEGPEAARQQFAHGVPPSIVDSLPKEPESEREPAVPDATSVTSESADPAGVIPGRPEAVTAEPASSAEVATGECVPLQQLESSAVQEEPVEESPEVETAEEAAAEPSLPEAVTVATTELERLAVSAADEALAAAPPLEPAPESVSPALDSDQPAESTEEVPAAPEEVVKSPVTAVVVNGSQSHSSVVSDKPYAPVVPIEQKAPHLNGQNGGQSAADENGVKEIPPAGPQEPTPEPEEPKETAVVSEELQEVTDGSKEPPVEVTTESPSEQSPEPTPALTPPSEDTPADSSAQGTPASTPADTPSLGTPVGTPSGTPAASRQGSPPPVNGTAGRPVQPATESPPRHLAAKGDGRPTPPAPAPSHAAKKHYGRSELLALQHAPLSQQRPAALPDLPSVVRRAGATTDQRAAALKPRPIGPGEFASGFKPAVMGPPGKYRGRSSQGGVGGGGGGRRDGSLQSPAPPVRRIEISRDVKLHTTENAWKPGAAKPGAESAEDSADAEAQLVARLKGILNKITPSNIEKHIENIRQLEFNTDERLGKMINVLFDKAVNEPAYASQYAAVCLAMTKPPAGSEDESKKAMSMFRKLLLTQCQREFEKDKSLELNLGERQREIEAQTDPVERRAKERALEEAQRQGRLRSNGNIRFIGELYKLSMLTDRIMQQCITKLLKDRHEDSYECMCKLVSTIGQKLEVAEKKQGRDLGKMFAEFERLSVDKKLSSRIRFMLRDLIELRANHWVPTRTTAQPRPMTIEEVHEQARLAEAKQQAALAQAEDRRRSERRRGGGGRDAPRPGGDGWSTVGRNSRYDASRMMSAVSATAAAPPPAQLKLGPGGGSGWGLGAKGASPRRASPATTPGSGANRFQALRAEARSRSRGGSAERSGSRNSSADRAPPPPAAAASRLKGPADADADYLKRQARAIVGEFLENGDEESAIVDCEGHLHDSTLADFVTQSLEAFVDARSARERQAAGRLHALLLQRGLLPVAAYVSGARQLLDVSADLATDVPAVWTNLAQLMTPPLLAPGAGLSLSALAAAAYGCVQDGGGVKLTVALLRQLRAEDEQRARELVPAGFNWQRLLGDREPLAVLKEADLECLVSGDPSPLPADRAPPVPGLRALLDAIRSDVPLARWLELNCPQPEKRQHPSFVADLVAAVCFDALIAESGALRVASERIERYCDLLRPVLEPAERQEAAVRAAADLVRHLDCSTDVLEQLLERLLTLRLVSEPALRHWREAVGGDPIVPPLRFLQP
ncbi:eukaryotic translation initiation factor 4 gamma 1-like isoform X2 [Amphibalanus amphitrite]|uniref:eukaryotic translation initiation factor 4 gamma 1-like isoform X2 n=1 Tax=Amphibalanus amphitrite TaxID=1232801 RepID=UPI001C901C67|nr:eukaryotic translation initiation factor 4 gamma 1-like isoform X2 [Amphibalanus amphitrite]